jgi:putative holliday junction resolvase
LSTKLGVDAGLARIGVALSQGSLCLPIETIPNTAGAAAEILQIANSRLASVIYVGLPLGLSGNQTASSKMAMALARSLQALTPLPVRMVDERLTTKSAQAKFREAGKNTKQSKPGIDAASAAMILEFALQSEREGLLAGKSLEELDA